MGVCVSLCVCERESPSMSALVCQYGCMRFFVCVCMHASICERLYLFLKKLMAGGGGGRAGGKLFYIFVNGIFY